MLCPNCGQELSGQETICPSCGQALPIPDDQITDEAADEAAEDAQPVPEEPTDAETSAGEDETDSEASAEDETEADSEASAEDETEADSEASAEDAKEGTANFPEQESEPAPAPKKKSHAAVILGAVVGLLLIVVVCLTITLTTVSKTGNMPGFVTAIQNFVKNKSFNADAIAVDVQDQSGNNLAEINNEEFSYYYWGEYYYYIQNNGTSFDVSKPLDEQSYSDSQTWQDYFVSAACTSIIQVEALKAEANNAGFTMPDEYQSEYDSTVSSMASYAKQAGFTDKNGDGDVLAYVQDSYGSSATVDTFKQYLYDSYFVTAYSDEIYNGFTYTDDQLESYYDDNTDTFTSYGITKTDQPDVSVRHILITPTEPDTSDADSSSVEDADTTAAESEDSSAEDSTDGGYSAAAWAAAKEQADSILEEWKSGDATEDSFGDLANTYSTDTGSNTNGGLYDDVYPGQMVTEFNDWCFDSSRKAGDTAVIKTEYGYHVMYFVGTTDKYYWKTAVQSQMQYEDYSTKINEITSQYTTKVTDDMDICTPDAITTIQKNAEASSSSEDTGTTTDTGTDTATGTTTDTAASAADAETSTAG